MNFDLLITFGLALLGGLILNVMPCVLPVLTGKVYKLVSQSTIAQGQSSEDRLRSARIDSAWYTVGVLLVFVAIISATLSLKLAGREYSWGMQFQSPVFVGAVCLTMFLLGLNGLGVFEITVSVSGSEKSGAVGSVFNGAVAAIMATPCSAPFLGAAITYAVKLDTPIWEMVVIFLLIGFGLALPFLAVAWFPSLARLLPRPGAWMVTFKQLMGFTLLGAAVWMFGVLLKQVNSDSAFWFLGFLLLVGLGAWAIDRFGGLEHDAGRRWAVKGLVVALLAAAGVYAFRFQPAAAIAATRSVDLHVAVLDGKINWVSFSPEVVAIHQRRKQPVFVDYTAEWCVNCKANEKAVLETETVRAALEETRILPVKADWTNEDELIGGELKKLGRSGIPAYAIYLPDGSFDLLPEVITESMVVERLRAAAARFPADQYLSVEQACLAQK